MKTILLTGGSGAVGSAIVPELLKDSSLRLILLLRPTPEYSVLERFQKLKKYWADYGLDDSVWQRVDVLTGDVARDQLGVGSDAYRTLVKDVTHIVHGAAQVKLNMSQEEAHRNSVATTVHVLRFAQECRVLKKLEYLSTVGVAGTIEGAIPERRISEPRNFHNTYESSKAEAEDLVWAAMDRGLPVTIHRPSMVVGDSRDGRTLHFQVFYHLIEFLSGRSTAGWVPRLPKFCLDVVPNDYVARAVAASVKNPLWAGQVLHLSAGRDGSMALDQFVSVLPMLLSQANLPTRPPHRFPWRLFPFLVSLASLAGPSQHRKAFHHLPRFLSYLKEETFFDNQNALRLLKSEEISLPDIKNILAPIIAYYVSHKDQRQKG